MRGQIDSESVMNSDEAAITETICNTGAEREKQGRQLPGPLLGREKV